MKRTTLSLLLLFVALCLNAEIRAPRIAKERAIISNIDSYIQQSMEQWGIPGAAISIVTDDTLIFAKGYGVKEVGLPDAVDEHTVFKIGSVTKAFTPVMFAQLVDEGKVKWDDKIKDILPDFKMKDPLATREMCIKDLFCHWSGLKGQSGANMYCLGYDRYDLPRIVAEFNPDYAFRNGYQYNTFFYSISAIVLEKITGKTWEENLQERILTPLGMTETLIGGNGLTAAENKAQSHYLKRENDCQVATVRTLRHQPLHRLDEISSAGAIVSNVCDMSKWIKFQLNDGVVDGKRLVSSKQMKETHRGLNIVRQSDDAIVLYGYGWQVEQSAKGRLYSHTGSSFGHLAICGWMPELDLGVMISVNCNNDGGFRKAMLSRVIDLFLGLPDTDYNSAAFEKYSRAEEKKAEKKAAAQKPVEKPAPSDKSIVGTYLNPTLGEAIVENACGDLYITVGPGKWQHELSHRNGYTFEFESDGVVFPVKFKGDSLIINFGTDYKDLGWWIKQ